MPQLSEHFKRSEFACRCGCGYDTVDADLVRVLQALRYQLNAPISIESGTRCKAHNKAVGGVASSQHLVGKAADIKVKGVSPSDVQKELQPHVGGLGSYDTFTHVDVRNGRARWSG